MWYPFKNFIQKVKFYKSLGEYKTYIETVENTLASGEVNVYYRAKWVRQDLSTTCISEHGDIWNSGKVVFNTEKEAKQAIDKFIVDRKRLEDSMVVKTKTIKSRYP